MHTEGMRDDPINHTKRKHEWKWNNRGKVWDKIAPDWAGDDDWISKRKDKTSSPDKTEFVTLIHRKSKRKRKGKTSGLRTAKEIRAC